MTDLRILQEAVLALENGLGVCLGRGHALCAAETGAFREEGVMSRIPLPDIQAVHDTSAAMHSHKSGNLRIECLQHAMHRQCCSHVILQHGSILLRKAHLSSYESMCSPDAAPVQDVLHATAHGGVAADLQRIAWAHCQDEIVLT